MRASSAAAAAGRRCASRPSGLARMSDPLASLSAFGDPRSAAAIVLPTSKGDEASQSR